jgi:type II secretory pathway pseudopilin PulG
MIPTAIFDSGLPPAPWDIYWPTVALVVVSGLAVLAALSTLRAIKAQVVEMHKTGEQTEKLIQEAVLQSIAAKRSADAIINSERAWVDGEFAPSEDISNPGDFSHMTYVLTITNQGRTPAQILNWQITIDAYNHETEEARKTKSHNTKRNLHALLASNGVHTVGEEFRLADYFENADAALLGIETALISITIEYRDLVTGSNLPHETSLRYSFQNGNLERISQFNVYK